MPARLQPRKTPRQARSQQMVEAILEAAARVLAERGYAGTNTNLVAERAGVSVGSLYQYFPNKDALITALHERHALQMHGVIERVLGAEPPPEGLRGQVGALVRALVAAHQLEPELHRVLERDLPFFDPPREHSVADDRIFRCVRQLLEAYRDEIAPTDRDVATWAVLQTLESLVHACVVDAPPALSVPAMEAAIVDMLMGYLQPGSRAAAS